MIKKFNIVCIKKNALITKLEHGRSSPMKVFHDRNRRAVSEVIATLLLVSVTIAGAVMVSNFFQSSNVANIGSQFNSNTLQAQSPATIQLTGYDTRDGTGLSGINTTKTGTDLDNFYNSLLCTESCKNSANNLPTQSPKGTEFIILRIKNFGSSAVTISDILVNDIDHYWDTSSTATGNLAISAGGKYPQAGKFIIIPTSNSNPIPIMSTNVVQGDNEVRLLIKLSKDVVMNSGSPTDLSLNVPIKISIHAGTPNPPTFAILSGDLM